MKCRRIRKLRVTKFASWYTLGVSFSEKNADQHIFTIIHAIRSRNKTRQENISLSTNRLTVNVPRGHFVQEGDTRHKVSGRSESLGSQNLPHGIL